MSAFVKGLSCIDARADSIRLHLDGKGSQRTGYQLGTSLYQLVPEGTSWYQLVPAGTSWYQLVPAGTSWYQLIPACTSWYQPVPADTSWRQNTYKTYKTLTKKAYTKSLQNTYKTYKQLTKSLQKAYKKLTKLTRLVNFARLGHAITHIGVSMVSNLKSMP